MEAQNTNSKVIEGNIEELKTEILKARDANEELKKLLKSKEIGEDEEKSFEKNVQNITDKLIIKLVQPLASKRQ